MELQSLVPRPLFFTLLLLIALGGTGCRTGADALTPAPAPQSVIMKVDGRPVLQSELDAITEEIIAQAPPEMANKIEVMRPRIREKAREELIIRNILAHAMKTEGIEPSEERIAAEIEAIDVYLKARSLSLEQYMQQSNTTPEAVRSEVREKLSYEMLYDKLLALQPPSEAEIRAYYDQNLTRYSRPQAAQMSEILLLFPAAREPEREEVAALMEKMEGYARRLETGEDFAQLAREVSQGPTAEKGGAMGWIFPDSALPPPVIEAAFEQEVGRAGQVVRSIFGLHIFLVTERREVEQLPYEQVQSIVTADIQRERRAAQVPGLLKRLRRQAKIETPPFAAEATQ